MVIGHHILMAFVADSCSVGQPPNVFHGRPFNGQGKESGTAVLIGYVCDSVQSTGFENKPLPAQGERRRFLVLHFERHFHYDPRYYADRAL
jgi:hypothetical protein